MLLVEGLSESPEVSLPGPLSPSRVPPPRALADSQVSGLLEGPLGGLKHSRPLLCFQGNFTGAHSLVRGLCLEVQVKPDVSKEPTAQEIPEGPQDHSCSYHKCQKRLGTTRSMPLLNR